MAQRHGHEWVDLRVLKPWWRYSIASGPCRHYVSVMHHVAEIGGGDTRVRSYHLDDGYVGNSFTVVHLDGADYQVKMQPPAGGEDIDDLKQGAAYTLSGVYRWNWKHRGCFTRSNWCLRIGWSKGVDKG